jgi:hypothetical protein
MTLGTKRVVNTAVTPTSHAVQHGESSIVSQAADSQEIQCGHSYRSRWPGQNPHFKPGLPWKSLFQHRKLA